MEVFRRETGALARAEWEPGFFYRGGRVEKWEGWKDKRSIVQGVVNKGGERAKVGKKNKDTGALCKKAAH